MLIIGLTGSIGMGKSTTADVLRQRGIAVFDADAAVHQLYDGPAVAAIEAVFPGSSVDGRVDRQKLSRLLAKDPNGLPRLEAIVHPLVRDVQADFLLQQQSSGAKVAVLEIPLLFETGGETRVDVVVVVSASKATQAERVLERPGMTPQKLDQLLARQLPDAEKRARADFIVDTDQSPEESAAQIDDILSKIAGRVGNAYQRYWQ